MKKIFILLLLLCSLQLFSQTIYYVKTTGNDANSGTSWATAFKTLQKALAVSTSGSEIWVERGTYYPDEGPGITNNRRDTSFVLKNGVAILGGFADNGNAPRDPEANATILSGDIDKNGDIANNAYHVLQAYSADASAVLDGFFIISGYANGSGANNDGGGILNNNAAPSLVNCTFKGNQAGGDGGGMFNNHSSPKLTGCHFIENKAGNVSYADGGGMYNYNSSPAVTNCRFSGNTSGWEGGGMANVYSNPSVKSCIFSANTSGHEGGGISNYHSSCSIASCLFWQNWTGQYGGGITNYESSPVITNCTFSGNVTYFGKGGGINNNWSSPTIVNCIVWGNTGEISDFNRFEYNISYSIVRGGYNKRALDVDPQFVNADSGNFSLRCGSSPAINTGTNAYVFTSTDASGYTRIINGRVDMGAFEYRGILYVDVHATGLHDGSSWANAFTSLQDALNFDACQANQVWVAAATYYPDKGAGISENDRHASFNLRNNLSVFGGFAGTETLVSQRDPQVNVTILSGDIDGDGTVSGNAYHVVTADSVKHTALLDGFTITGGHANGSGSDSRGGGLFITSSNVSIPAPRIYSCIFSGNKAVEGGAVYTTASFPSFFRCSFSGNNAISGGAFYNAGSSQTTILNSLFTGNTAANGGAIYNSGQTVLQVNNGLFFQNAATGAIAGTYKGGAVYSSASYADLINCSFSGNTASAGYGGTLYNESSSPHMTNSILWGNSSEVDRDANSNPVISYSIVQGGYAGGSNIINADPLFRDTATGDLHLQPGSPAIDAGTGEGTYLTDLEGYPRMQGNQVDMGAYEFATAAGPPGPLVLTCPQDYTLVTDAGSCGAVADFTGDHAAVTSGGTAPITIFYDPVSGSELPPGINIITVTATDGAGQTKTCSFTINVVDAAAPVVSNFSADKPVLYPPNHKMQEVKLNYSVSDNCPDVATALSVTSNEPQYGSGSGDTGPDWQVVNDHELKLRSERSGNGSDRVYTIILTASDASGNTSTATTTVTVPHDNRPTVTMSQPASNKPESNKEESSLFVTVVPNPSAEGFTLYMQTPSALPLTIRVMDGAGRIVESRRGVVANGSLYFGNNYRPGVYYVQVMQGDVLQTIKLVKQGR